MPIFTNYFSYLKITLQDIRISTIFNLPLHRPKWILGYNFPPYRYGPPFCPWNYKRITACLSILISIVLQYKGWYRHQRVQQYCHYRRGHDKIYFLEIKGTTTASRPLIVFRNELKNNKNKFPASWTHLKIYH